MPVSPRAFGGGVAAAMAMTGLRTVTAGVGLVDQTPPEAIATQRAPRLLGLVPPDRRRVAIELAHWTYGGLGGLVFAALPRRVHRRRWSGPAYGVATWLAFEAGIAPALGLRQARESRPLERALILADHLLYGVLVAGERRDADRTPLA